MKLSRFEMLGASFLITAWSLYGISLIGDYLVPVSEAPAQSSMAKAPEAAKKSTPAAGETANLSDLLASATPADGEKAFKKCKSCHSADKGGKNKVGPNLWNVAGGPKASIAGFKYSDALKNLGGTWSLADLDAFIENPKGTVPGTRMSYRGMKNAGSRAALVLYLRGQSDTPPPLP